MLGPPVVMSRGRPVGGAFDVTVVGLPVLARAVAAPPVLPVLIHLVVESMVHLGERERSALRRQVNKFKNIGKRPFIVQTFQFLRASCSDTLGEDSN